MKDISARFKAAEDGYWIIASTNDLDRDREIIEPTAFTNLQEYLSRNPVVLFSHDRFSPPIGKAVDGRIGGDGLFLKIVFAETELGQEVRYLYENGFMNSFSVGFIPKAWRDLETGIRVYTEVELLEVSAVTIPANSAAVMIRTAGLKRGKELEQIAKMLNVPLGQQSPKAGKTAEEKRIEAIKRFARAVR